MISPSVFLTAAHCLVFFERRGLAGGMSDPHDIAVIVFDEPVASISPAGLPVR